MAIRRQPGRADESDFQEPKGPRAGAGPVGAAPGPPPPPGSEGQVGYGPRENFPRPEQPGLPVGGPGASPRRPMAPTTADTGSTMQSGGPSGAPGGGGMIPFQPLPSIGSGMFGSMGGLKGGGLGVPQTGFGGAANDPIAGLMQLLQQLGAGGVK